jgi:SSS family solute:Na+ symporter
LHCLLSKPLQAGDYPKVLKVYRGSTPKLDGIISPGEYSDAIQFSGTFDWIHEFNPNSDSLDLSIKAWVKHDGKNLYFAFDVTDDIIYGIDIPRWLPANDSAVHSFTLNSSPWFGDGIELYLNPQNKWNRIESDLAAGNGFSWQMECSVHKSFQHKLEKGGLIEGNPRNEKAWNIYRKWMKAGFMKAVVRLKPESEVHGYIVEWEIAANPCLEVSKGVFWKPENGIASMGLNIEIQDVDEEEKGVGNFDNMHHVDVWTSRNGEKSELRNWGTMVIYPGYKPK